VDHPPTDATPKRRYFSWILAAATVCYSVKGLRVWRVATEARTAARLREDGRWPDTNAAPAVAIHLVAFVTTGQTATLGTATVGYGR
jgi:hypothetical protein